MVPGNAMCPVLAMGSPAGAKRIPRRITNTRGRRLGNGGCAGRDSSTPCLRALVPAKRATPDKRRVLGSGQQEVPVLSAVVVALLLVPTADLPVIAPHQARDHVGEEVVVRGQMLQLGASENGDTRFLNFGGRYPDHVFNAVIF